jgi:alpha-L-rhamnosidase
MWVLRGSVVAVVVALSCTSTAAATTGARALSRRPIAEDARWRTHVLDPQQQYAYPRAVVVEGDRAAVSDPDALTRRGGATTITATATATAAGSPRLLLDLGVNTGGIVQATVSAGSGATVRLAYSEARRFLTPIGDTGENSLGDNDEPYARFDTFAGNAGTYFSSPATRGGERWVLLQLDGPGTVTIKDVRVRVQHLRATPADYRGHFLSSDDTLNRAWYASAYTFDASTTGDTLVVQDGAKRDRLVFAGDLGIAELVGLNTVGVGPQVIHNSLRLLSCQPELGISIATYSNTDIACPEDPADALPIGPLPKVDLSNLSPLAALSGQAALPSGEYVAWYVAASASYYRYTADEDYVRKLLPVLRRGMSFLRLLEVGGLYSAPLDYTWRAGLTSGVSPYTNSVYYAALRGLAQLERAIGAGAKAADGFDVHADAVRRALVAKFGDSATGALLADPSGAPGVHLQDANVMAPYVGVLESDAATRALDYVAAKMDSPYGTTVFDGGTTFGPKFVSPFMTSWELLARLQRRQTAPALSLIRRLWGHMAHTDPESTVWEKVALNGEVQPNQPNTGGQPTTRNEGVGYVSLAHAWSGGPVPALSGYVLGARPLSAGFARWIVAPQPGDLRWAQGQVPTPAGPLVSRFKHGKAFLQLTVGAPQDTAGEVELPLLGADRTIYRDGRAVWKDGRARGVAKAVRDGDVVRFEQGPGVSTYAWGVQGAPARKRS